MLTGGCDDEEDTMDFAGNLLTIGVPALVGLFGWIVLRQRDAPPLLAGCSAMVIALATMTAIFVLLYMM